MLEQELLATEPSARSLDGVSDAESITPTIEASSGSAGAGGRWGASCRAVQKSAYRPPVANQGGGGTECATATLRGGENFKCIALGIHRRFGLGRARSAGQWADGRRQANQVKPLTLEPLGGAGQPVAGRTRSWHSDALARRSSEGCHAVAQQMNAIGEVAGGVGARPFEKGIQITMARRTVRGDPREMRLGYADR